MKKHDWLKVVIYVVGAGILAASYYLNIETVRKMHWWQVVLSALGILAGYFVFLFIFFMGIFLYNGKYFKE